MNNTASLMLRSINDMVWSGVQIENIDATFVQTKEVIAQSKTQGLSERATIEIIGLKRAWEFIFDNLEQEGDWNIYSNINRILGEGTIPNAGKIRGPNDVVVYGLQTEPYIPRTDISENLFERIVSTVSDSDLLPHERAAMLFAQLAKTQFFANGNKRSALIFTNHYLAYHDYGIAFVVDEETKEQVYNYLFEYYCDRLSLDDIIWELSANNTLRLENLAASRNDTRSHSPQTSLIDECINGKLLIEETIATETSYRSILPPQKGDGRRSEEI